MPGATDEPIVLLYVHALLGQGLADHLRAVTGLPVIAVPVSDAGAVDAALADRPRVVIFEQSSGVDELALRRRARQARLIDVSGAVAPAGCTVTEQGGAPAAETIVEIVDREYALAR